MPTNPKTILAINPGSRYLGVAVLVGPELREWRIKTLPSKGSPTKTEKAKSIIFDLLYFHQPTVIALKQLHPSRSSVHLNQLVKLIGTIAKSRGLSMYCYSLKQMKIFFSEEKRIKSKRQLSEKLCTIYPALYSELHKEKDNKNSYHSRMFESVALGTLCFDQLDKVPTTINS